MPDEAAPQSAADQDGVTADPLAPLHDLDELGADQALGVLHRYSLIQLTPQAIAVHRLVQAVIRASHSPETRGAYAAGGRLLGPASTAGARS